MSEGAKRSEASHNATHIVGFELLFSPLCSAPLLRSAPLRSCAPLRFARSPVIPDERINRDEHIRFERVPIRQFSLYVRSQRVKDRLENKWEGESDENYEICIFREPAERAKIVE